MKILDVLVNVARELQEFLHCLGRLLLRCLEGQVNISRLEYSSLNTHLIAPGLTATLDSKELIHCVGLGRVLSGTGLCLRKYFFYVAF